MSSIRQNIFLLQIAASSWLAVNDLQAALLGLTDEAKRDVVHNFSGTHPSFRFQAIWGPNFDWIPDHDHGGVAIATAELNSTARPGGCTTRPSGRSQTHRRR